MNKILNLRLFLLVACVFLGIGAKAVDVTLSYATTTTTNMTGGNDAATLGLDATAWSVVASKGGHSLYPGLNKGGYIALYYNSGGNNSITVSSLSSGVTITGITITYTGTSYNNGSVTVDGNEVSGTNGTYSINSSSFTIGNANTSNAQVRIKSIVISYTSSSSNSAATPTMTASAEFTSTQDVTITNNESGSTVYYTTDGNDPTTSSSSFTGSSKTITLSATTTVKAMAVISGKDNSLVASTTYTYLPTVDNIAAFKNLTVGTKAVLNLTDAVVSYVNGSDHYAQDATGGIDLYGSSYAVGTKLNGTVTGTFTLYNGTPEVASGTYNVTSTTDGSVSGQVVQISQLKGTDKADYACMKITLQNVSYADGMLVDEDGDSITLYDKSSLLSDYAWADKVNFTGVFCNYYTSSKTTPEVLPISVDDIVVVAGKASPKNVWRITAYKGSDANVYPTFSTASDGTKTYKSSVTDAATIDASGSVTLVNSGTTTISCYAGVSSTYKATQTVSYELLVDIAGEKDTIDFDTSAIPSGWTKSNASYISDAGRYNTSAPGLGMSGATTASTLTGHSYYNVQAITFYANATSKGSGGKIAIKYSTDSTTWNVLDSIAITYNAAGMVQYIVSSDVISTISSLGNVYLQFYSGFNTPYLDDIVITYTASPNVLDPVFGQTQTAVEDAFNLTITNPNTLEGTYDIYYTTDESDPRTSTTKQTYSAAIPVSQSTTVKAVIAYTDGNSNTFNSDVTTATYTFLTGRGTFENPYTVSDVITLDNSKTDSCWVVGVIVKGYAETVSKTDVNGIVEQDTIASNIVLTADGTVSAQNIPVKLAASPIRNYVNIKDNAANEGQTIKIYGTMASYYSRPGITLPVKVYVNGYYYTNIWGDVNADLKRDLTDVTALADILVTGTDNTGGMSDVTGYDKQTTIKDLPRLIKYLVPSTSGQ